MKSSKLSTILSATVLSAGLAFALSTLPASAQTTPGIGTQDTYETRQGIQDDNDWGAWGLLGLLGLPGLFGLAGLNRKESRNETPTYSPERASR